MNFLVGSNIFHGFGFEFGWQNPMDLDPLPSLCLNTEKIKKIGNAPWIGLGLQHSPAQR